MKLFIQLFRIIYKLVSLLNRRVSAKDKLKYSKIIADSQSVSNTIYSLSNRCKNADTKLDIDKFIKHKVKIDKLLKEFSLNETGYEYNYLPLEISYSEKNIDKVKLITTILSTLLNEVRILIHKERFNIAPNQISLALKLSSVNPDNYYESINSSNDLITLEDHKLKDLIEIMSMQDMNFKERAITSDLSIMNLWEHCPNIKVLELFGTELTYKELCELKLNKLRKLKSLILADNNLEELPSYFSSMQKLEYLDLRNNNLLYLPIELSNFNKLKYLNVEKNKLPEKEKERLRKQLSSTIIKF